MTINKPTCHLDLLIDEGLFIVIEDALDITRRSRRLNGAELATYLANKRIHEIQKCGKDRSNRCYNQRKQIYYF